MRQTIFKDKNLQTAFDTDGFVKIDLLRSADVEALKLVFAAYFPGEIKRFFSSSYLDDYALKTEISKAIQNIIGPRLDDYFLDYRSFGSSFLVKGTDRESEMPMHQDWTIVDEEKYSAINIWTPLVHADENNGTIELLKGSHNWKRSVRAPTLPFHFEKYKSRIREKMTAVITKPGEAVLINQACIHCSRPNLSAAHRIAITTGITSSDAPLRLYYWNKQNPDQLERFEQADDFLLNFTEFHRSIFERPAMGRSVGMEPFLFPTITEAEVDTFLSSLGPKTQPVKGGFLNSVLQKIIGKKQGQAAANP